MYHVEFGMTVMINFCIIRQDGMTLRIVREEGDDTSEYSFNPIFIGARVCWVPPNSVDLIMFPQQVTHYLAWSALLLLLLLLLNLCIVIVIRLFTGLLHRSGQIDSLIHFLERR